MRGCDRRQPRSSGWFCGHQWRPGGFEVPGSGKAGAGGLPSSGVLEDQILDDLAPAQRQELGELVLIRLAGDAAADDDMRGDALVPHRAPDDQALDIEQRFRQQALITPTGKTAYVEGACSSPGAERQMVQQRDDTCYHHRSTGNSSEDMLLRSKKRCPTNCWTSSFIILAALPKG